MNYQDTLRELQKFSESGRAFITVTGLAEALGVKQHRTAIKYLKGLEAVDGKYFLIRDVVKALQQRKGVPYQ